MLRRALMTALLLVLAAPAAGFERITDADEFARLIEGRALIRFGIRLQVSTGDQPQRGQISGRGFGYPVTGAWHWEGGYFCRDLDWGGSDLGFNCQAVLRNGTVLRFVSDQGGGDYADFRLQ